jgi:TRAP-type C4-dicarboxylate transport system permease small subunit
MTRVVDVYFHALKVIIALSLAIMCVLVFGNVVLRYAFNTGITVSEEISRWLFVYLTFLGAIVAFRERGHLGVDMLVAKLGLGGKKLCMWLNLLLMLGVTYLLLVGSWQQMMINMDVTAPASGLSVGIFYGVGVIFAVSTGINILYDIYRLATGRMTEEELVAIKESEEAEELEELGKEIAEHEHQPPPPLTHR